MDAIEWEHRPKLTRPVLVAAFGGWNDAGDAASGAVRFLAGQWHARSFATIDAEEFFDFSQSRPVVRLDDGVTREVEWPTNRFTATGLPENCDVVFLHGTEPQLKWRTFCSLVIDVAKSLGVEEVITLGSMLTDVPHTHPAQVTAATSDVRLMDFFKLRPTQYEGPIGVVGVLNDMCDKEGMDATSLWASVPHYVGQTPSPKATLSLVNATLDILSTTVDTSDLEAAAAAYEEQISELVSSDEEIASYVAQLERTQDEPAPDADAIADEAQKFLRGEGS